VRKYFAIVLGVLLVLGVAATASAMDTDITLGGKILIRGWYLKNVDNGLPSDSSSEALYSTNANLTVDIKVEENVRGFMELETSCGGSGNCGLYYWGGNGGSQNAGGTYDTKPQAPLYFRQLWIMYTGSGLLGVPSGIKAGHMPISLGEKVFLNNERFGDDAILVWVDPTKELHLAAGLAKLFEGAYTNHTDDVDGYIALGTYALDKDNTLGLNWTYIHSDGFCPSLNFAPFTGTLPNVDKLNVHNVGIHANGDISGLTYAASLNWQFGKVEATIPHGGAWDVVTAPPPTPDSIKAKGWAALVKLGYMVDPINIRGSFAYGSGDSDGINDGDCGEFQTLQGPDEIGAFARLVHYTQIYERTIQTTSQHALLTTTPGGNVRNTGIANTTYYNLGLDWQATPALRLALDGFILRATKVPTGSGWSKAAGTELDFKGEYKIAKNLSYFVEAAGFWAGNYYEDSGLVAEKENVTQLIHGLLLKF
jgi:hypothetical protein